MTGKRPRVVLSGPANMASQELADALNNFAEVVQPETPGAHDADGVLLAGIDGNVIDCLPLIAGGLLAALPDGLAIIDASENIVWHNDAFGGLAGDPEGRFVGRPLLESLGQPELRSPRSFQLLAEPNSSAKAIYSLSNRSHLACRTAWFKPPGSNAMTVVSLRDVSDEVFENTKRKALYTAGIELGDLSPDEVREMGQEERIELLKEGILSSCQEILGFDTIEIRLLDPDTNELIPLLEEGMKEEAAERSLFAETTDNGVTGFVAATGESRLCTDTQSDPLYLAGAEDARSSLTVPLVMHEDVLGTFNVESPGAQRFDERDLEFLELFASVVALAINQLQLLRAEQEFSRAESSDRLLRNVALPTDDILSSATALLEKYIGHDPEVCETLQRIVENTRKIRSQIVRVSGAETEESKLPIGLGRPRDDRPALKDKRILVVDSDESVLSSAHELLDRHSCTVETVRTGAAACQMARSHHYDVVLTDIRLSDMNGYECFCNIKDIDDHLPVILMTGFGYDAGHSIVKSRQRGLKAVLYKPFRREQLLTEVEKAVTPPPPVG